MILKLHKHTHYYFVISSFNQRIPYRDTYVTVCVCERQRDEGEGKREREREEKERQGWER